MSSKIKFLLNIIKQETIENIKENLLTRELM